MVRRKEYAHSMDFSSLSSHWEDFRAMNRGNSVLECFSLFPVAESDFVSFTNKHKIKKCLTRKLHLATSQNYKGSQTEALGGSQKPVVCSLLTLVEGFSGTRNEVVPVWVAKWLEHHSIPG